MKSYEGQAPTDIEDQVESDRTHHVEGGKSIPLLEPYKGLVSERKQNTGRRSSKQVPYGGYSFNLMSRRGAAASVPDHVGNWLECHNRNCGFPIRVPTQPAKKSGRGSGGVGSLLFACPVCLEVSSYTKKELRRVRFRSPDPYQGGKLVLYSTTVGCTHPRCSEKVTIFATAAASVSVATLVEFWKHWKVNLRCAARHRFRMAQPALWWIQEERALGWSGEPGLQLSKK